MGEESAREWKWERRTLLALDAWRLALTVVVDACFCNSHSHCIPIPTISYSSHSSHLPFFRFSLLCFVCVFGYSSKLARVNFYRTGKKNKKTQYTHTHATQPHTRTPAHRCGQQNIMKRAYKKHIVYEIFPESRLFFPFWLFFVNCGATLVLPTRSPGGMHKKMLLGERKLGTCWATPNDAANSIAYRNAEENVAGRKKARMLQSFCLP